MTTEDDFQAALDRNPGDWQTRLVFADWLQERNDPRAEGYRCLGRRRWTAWTLSGGQFSWWDWGRRSNHSKGTPIPDAPGLGELPGDWYGAIGKAQKSARLHCREWDARREAEDAAALAFAKLPAGRRAELLATREAERVPRTGKGAPKKSAEPAARKPKAKKRKK